MAENVEYLLKLEKNWSIINIYVLLFVSYAEAMNSKRDYSQEERNMDEMMQAFILLLAGFLVVFVVLILLIVIVTLYSKIIRSAQSAGEKRAEKAKAASDEMQTEAKQELRSLTREEIEDNEGDIPPEIIAVIAAAVDAVYGDKPHRIRSVRHSRPARSAWASAGAMQNTRPF